MKLSLQFASNSDYDALIFSSPLPVTKKKVVVATECSALKTNENMIISMQFRHCLIFRYDDCETHMILSTCAGILCSVVSLVTI